MEVLIAIFGMLDGIVEMIRNRNSSISTEEAFNFPIRLSYSGSNVNPFRHAFDQIRII